MSQDDVIPEASAVPTSQPLATAETQPSPVRDRTAIWLLVIGVVLLCPYAVLSVLGWREYTSCFSGTMTPGDPEGIRGLSFAGAYFVAWVVTPVFVIAAGLDWAWGRIRRR